MSRKRYLGDSVYVELEGGMIKLTTENGLPGDPSNTIYLESYTYEALQRYVATLREEDAVEE
jgi:hypothetical protein